MLILKEKLQDLWRELCKFNTKAWDYRGKYEQSLKLKKFCTISNGKTVVLNITSYVTNQ